MTTDLGLTAAEVAERTVRGEVNAVEEESSRPLKLIIKANVFTRFNALLGALLVAVLVFGQWQDGLFGFLLLANSLIGIVQEVRAKRTLDRLAVLNAPLARVVRDGAATELPVGQIVLDDLIELRAGDQAPADGEVQTSTNLEIDESLLTGESDPVAKGAGDTVLSGGIVVAGSGRFRATKVGADAYARQLATEARRFTQTRSELMQGIDRILTYISWAIVVVGPILLWSQLRGNEGTRKAVSAAVAGMTGMVPEGLVLLTSMAFLLAALTLARRQVLVQELPAVEGLARVDVVCLDKTGTLTEGDIDFGRFEVVQPAGDEAEQVPAVLGAMAADPNPNATLQALGNAFVAPEGWTTLESVAFSSARKWSAMTFRDQGSWVLGAPEIVLALAAASTSSARSRADELAAAGQRVLVLAHTDEALAGEQLPGAIRPVALLTFDERIRPDAEETLRYFARQGVVLKVISGDNPRTVGAVAARVGLPDADRLIDARELPQDPTALAEVVEHNAVFGRVTPQQKRAMVRALQSKGHVVAMTGDGVNDALALKDADIGVAMGSGAAATRAVAQLVLLDGRFSKLPDVVAEGRRVMANIERVASLFLIKNVYATALALAVAVARLPYPFLPRHLTIISALTIGIPGFFLALAPNLRRYEPGFLKRVLRFAVPTGLLTATAVYIGYRIARSQRVTGDGARTAATIVIMVIGLWVLVLLARPLRGWKLALIATMGGLFVLALAVPESRSFFALNVPLKVLVESSALGVAGAAGVTIGWRFARAVQRRVEAGR